MIELQKITGQPTEGKRSGSRRLLPFRWQPRGTVIGAGLFGAGTLAVAIALHQVPRLRTATEQYTEKGITRTALPALPAPNLFKPLTPIQAQIANAQRPTVDRPDTPASKFRISGEKDSQLRATDCLAQAIYYEAASEGNDGERAVAQVVLNRLRHPGYPNSVCGVVYQGSERGRGCQFTFVCDGSLSRPPEAYLWTRAMNIARKALAGDVFAPVGHATHYHADYVVPYWADSLDKVAVIGRHIFYRLRGLSGSKRAFSQVYAKAEPAPLLPPTEETLTGSVTSTEDLAAAVVPRVEEDRISSLDVAKPASIQDNAPLKADLETSPLILGGAVAKQAKKANPAVACDKSRGPEKIMALDANNLNIGGAPSACR